VRRIRRQQVASAVCCLYLRLYERARGRNSAGQKLPIWNTTTASEMAGAEGFEPSALGFGDRCSDQTELRPYATGILPNPSGRPVSIGTMAAFLANVGVNSAHPVWSPLFGDGTFQLFPIPEADAWRPPMLRVRDVARLAAHAPATWHDRAIHVDPDLDSPTPTYGDNCRRAGRAFSLRRARPDDLIVFLARLQPADQPAGFYLVGSLEIDDVLADVVQDPGAGWWDGNAHVRRARATGAWDRFWVFKGSSRSRSLARAVPLRRVQLEVLFGDGLRWPSHRSELQTIGSHTRAVRRIEGAGEEWLRTICRS
jgi:hypothetical protein